MAVDPNRNESNITGNQNIVLQGVTGSTITLNVNGEVHELRNDLEELKSMLQKLQASSVRWQDQDFQTETLTRENFSFLTSRKAFNETLVRKLLVALAPYRDRAEKVLAKVESKGKNWASDENNRNFAQLHLEKCLVGVVSLQVSKLWAIGKEPLSPGKQQKYIGHCALTGTRVFQLLIFILISRLWDHLQTTSTSLTAEEIRAIQPFFRNTIDHGLPTHLELLEALVKIYSDHQFEFPIPEMNQLTEMTASGHSFKEAAIDLAFLKKKLDSSQFNLIDCFNAEKRLTTLLVGLAYLSEYRMVSIKEVAYDEMRNNPPRYLHNLSVLGFNSNSEKNAKRINYAENPVSTDGILFYKGKAYEQGLNMFPFIIDLNALTQEENSRICLFSSRNLGDGSLNYRFLEDNQQETIRYSETLKPGEDLNRLMMDDKKRTALKLDAVVLQFEAAEKTILGEGALADENDLTDEFEDEDF